MYELNMNDIMIYEIIINLFFRDGKHLWVFSAKAVADTSGLLDFEASCAP
jgi:hypothetical protein